MRGLLRINAKLPASRTCRHVLRPWLTQRSLGVYPSTDSTHHQSTSAIQYPAHSSLTTASVITKPAEPQLRVESHVKSASVLPLICPGCGAPGQIVNAKAPGYYGGRRTQKPVNIVKKSTEEDAVFAAAVGRGVLDDLTLLQAPVSDTSTPICERCHQLVHQNVGNSIIHPSIESVQAMIEESPYRQNHIYHVIDAVDFPLSVIPNLQTALDLPRLRTQNRRSRRITYLRGRIAEVSFIITRADLLAAKKEQVDALLPYMRDILRDALARTSRNARLGNVRMVSAKRGWWTPVLKEEIYRRGGAGWMVGKVNVGKSSLMEVVFPKGRSKLERVARTTRMANSASIAGPEFLAGACSPEEEPVPAHKWSDMQTLESPDGDVAIGEASSQDSEQDQDFEFDESELTLLPPKPQEEMYPTMPIVSALPGTTAAPIRLSFGSGRGELIDLPGVRRSDLPNFVLPEYHKQMIMHQRVVPEQQVVSPGQSLLLGGLIRITPRSEDVTFLMYPFVPPALHPHTTSTEKAIAIQTGIFAYTGEAYQGRVASIANEAARPNIKSASTFTLHWDVTKKQAGPLTANDAGKMKPHNLPFAIYGTDILIEGVGWVEITAQVRRHKSGEGEPIVPEVEVFTPNGGFVASRVPMNAWLLNKPPKGVSRSRPRQTVSYKRRMDGGRRGSPATFSSTS